MEMRMKDQKGNELKVGDRVRCTPDGCLRGQRFAYIRQIKDGQARIDDGPHDMIADISSAPTDQWSWCAWANSNDIVRVF